MTCDRHPSARALFVVYTRSGLLYLCGHCRDKHREPLRAFRVVPLAAHDAPSGQRLGS